MKYYQKCVNFAFNYFKNSALDPAGGLPSPRPHVVLLTPITNLLPPPLNGCESWVTKKADEQRIQAFEMKGTPADMESVEDSETIGH